MVSNHQQYLRADQKSPTMDSSPLALLAQTCNSIGLSDTAASFLKANKTKINLKTESKSKSDLEDRSSANSDFKSAESMKSTSDISPDPKSVSSVISSTSASGKCTGLSGGLSPNPLTFTSGTSYPPLFPPYYPSTSNGLVPFPSGLPPGSCYPSYPTVWPPSGFPQFAPKCADPYCKTCPSIAAAAMARANAQSCNAFGCPCNGQMTNLNTNHDFSSFWLSYGSLFGLNSAPQNPFAPNSMTTGTGIAQHTCSWMMGNEFCGKRFQTSDELLTHLKSHAQESQKSNSNQLAQPAPPPNAAAIGPSSPRSTYLNSYRFHPYAQPPTSTNGGKYSPQLPSAHAAAAAALASLQFPPNVQQVLCNSLAAQRLPPSLPHP